MLNPPCWTAQSPRPFSKLSNRESARTTTVFVSVAVRPVASVTVSSTVYVPGSSKAWVAVGPVAVVPSPNAHSSVNSSPSGSLDPEPSNSTVSPGMALRSDPASAVGASLVPGNSTPVVACRRRVEGDLLAGVWPVGRVLEDRPGPVVDEQRDVVGGHVAGVVGDGQFDRAVAEFVEPDRRVLAGDVGLAVLVYVHS